jgi:NAD(P)H-dependent flavin oxidoreductase YrpB (nitropropane dioxygenase family)
MPLESNEVLPDVIQGGMGIAVSTWQLAKEVSKSGGLGVVSATAIDSVIARRLQDGDLTGDIRRAFLNFPNQDIANEILNFYFIDGGREPEKPYLDVPKLSLKQTQLTVNLIALSVFTEVWLAKENNIGVIGVNALEKIQMATPATVFGAMLAGVDYILMGAGIPTQIPEMIRQFSELQPFRLNIDVANSKSAHFLAFDPKTIISQKIDIKKPKFLAIISSHALAAYLGKDEKTRPDGFIVEGPTAGGHNAPPRSKDAITEDGQSKFSELDEADLVKVAKTGLPFWLAGGYGTPSNLKGAKELGAVGIQVGSLFALADESGFTNVIKSELFDLLADEALHVKTDPYASPTGFPFKVVEIDGTLSEDISFDSRSRNCDLGYLRTPFERPQGGIGYRCPGEPIKTFEFKGGTSEHNSRSKCLCNALMADIGLGQIRADGTTELPLVTFGSDLAGANELSKIYPRGWNANQVLEYLRGN